MKAATLTALPRRWWRRADRRLSGLGLAGVGLIGAAVLAAVLLPGLRQSAELTQSTWEQRRSAMLRQDPRPPDPPTAQERLDRFVQYFPGFEQNAKDLQAVFQIAEQAQVALPKGDYVVHSDASSPFLTVTATFPVHEPYSALKDFVAQVLTELPNAALEELRLSRNDASDVTLEATVRFTLVYRRP